MTERNWAGNVVYAAGHIHRPTSVGELQEILATAEQVRILGSRHSFNTIADCTSLVSLQDMPR